MFARTVGTAFEPLSSIEVTRLCDDKSCSDLAQTCAEAERTRSPGGAESREAGAQGGLGSSRPDSAWDWVSRAPCTPRVSVLAAL